MGKPSRLRFGISDDFPKGRQAEYVLSSFDKEEQTELPALIDRSIEMIHSFIIIGTELTMTRFNNKSYSFATLGKMLRLLIYFRKS